MFSLEKRFGSSDRSDIGSRLYPAFKARSASVETIGEGSQLRSSPRIEARRPRDASEFFGDLSKFSCLAVEALSISLEPIGEGIQLRGSPVVEGHPPRDASQPFRYLSKFTRTI